MASVPQTNSSERNPNAPKGDRDNAHPGNVNLRNHDEPTGEKDAKPRQTDYDRDTVNPL